MPDGAGDQLGIGSRHEIRYPIDFELYEYFQDRFGCAFDPSLAPTHDATLDEWIRIVNRALAR